MTELSIITLSMSGSSEKCSNSACHIPLSLHLSKRLYTLLHLPYRSGNKRY